MADFIIYDFKAAACIAIFYLAYKLLLSRETFHGLNRAVLLGTVVLSFAIPASVITIERAVPAPQEITATFAQPLRQTIAPTLPAIADAQPAITPADDAHTPPTVEKGSSGRWIIPAVFLTGAAFAMLRSLLSLAAIIAAVGKGERVKIGRRITLVKKEGDIVPFSWLKYIVVSRRDYEEYGEQILTHEMAHLRLYHSLDLLLLDLAGCLQWFNPAIWLLRNEMRSVHEYEADRAVIQAGFDVKGYQMMLIKKAAGAGRYSIADSLNHSKLKNRITMMLQKESGPRARLKILAMLPLAALCLTAFAGREYASPHGKDRAKVSNIINSYAKWETPEGAGLSKFIEIMEPEGLPRYLAVDIEIVHKPYKDAETPSGIVEINNLDNMDAYFYIRPTNRPDQSISQKRFFIDVKKLPSSEAVNFSDISDLVKKYAPTLYESIPESIKIVPIFLSIQKNANCLSFDVKIDGTPTDKEYTYEIAGTDVFYVDGTTKTAEIRIDAKGDFYVEGEKTTIDNLRRTLKDKKHLTENDYGYLNAYEIKVLIDFDEKTKWGSVKALKKKLLANPIFSTFAYDIIPQSTPNTLTECSDSLFQYSTSGYLPDVNHIRRPYYETLTSTYYQTDDPEELRKNLIEIVIRGDKIYANGEPTSINRIESKIREIARRENRDVTKMIIGIKPEDDAEMGVVQRVRLAAYLMKPKWIAIPYLDGNRLFEYSPSKIELPE